MLVILAFIVNQFPAYFLLNLQFPNFVVRNIYQDISNNIKIETIQTEKNFETQLDSVNVS